MNKLKQRLKQRWRIVYEFSIREEIDGDGEYTDFLLEESDSFLRKINGDGEYSITIRKIKEYYTSLGVDDWEIIDEYSSIEDERLPKKVLKITKQIKG